MRVYGFPLTRILPYKGRNVEIYPYSCIFYVVFGMTVLNITVVVTTIVIKCIRRIFIIIFAKLSLA